MYSEQNNIYFLASLLGKESDVADVLTKTSQLQPAIQALCANLPAVQIEPVSGLTHYGTLMEDRSIYTPAPERSDLIYAFLDPVFDTLSPLHRAAAALYYHFSFSLSETAQLLSLSPEQLCGLLAHIERTMLSPMADKLSPYPLMRWYLGARSSHTPAPTFTTAETPAPPARTGITIPKLQLPQLQLSKKHLAAAVAVLAILALILIVSNQSPSAPAIQVSEVSSVVPEGCIYVRGDSTWKAGSNMPNAARTADVFQDSHYTYTLIGDGWHPTVHNKTLTEYPPLLEQINGAPVTSLSSTFENCINMTQAPKIPDSVSNLQKAFRNCHRLEEAPKIPEGVTNMASTFEYCLSLEKVGSIPYSVTNINYCFAYCFSLEHAPALPEQITQLEYTFAYCTALKEAPALPVFMKAIVGAFQYCISLTEAPTLPAGLLDMRYAFQGCSAITSVSEIPTLVDYMDHAFENCTSLTGTIVFHAKPITYSNCFLGTFFPIELSGSSFNTTLYRLVSTSSENNITVAISN